MYYIRGGRTIITRTVRHGYDMDVGSSPTPSTDYNKGGKTMPETGTMEDVRMDKVQEAAAALRTHQCPTCGSRHLTYETFCRKVEGLTAWEIVALMFESGGA